MNKLTNKTGHFRGVLPGVYEMASDNTNKPTNKVLKWVLERLYYHGLDNDNTLVLGLSNGAKILKNSGWPG